MVLRYTHLPPGCTHASAVENLTGTRPTTWNPRPTFRFATSITASAEAPPTLPVMVYLPGVSATNAPSPSIDADDSGPPSSTDQRIATSPSDLFAPPRTSALKRTTSPVSTDALSGVSVTFDTGPAMTCTGIACVAPPALAVIVAEPGATATTRPSGVTCATFELLEVKVTGS